MSSSSSYSEEEEREPDDSSDSDRTVTSDELEEYLMGGPIVPVLGGEDVEEIQVLPVLGERPETTEELYPIRKSVQDLVASIHDDEYEKGHKATENQRATTWAPHSYLGRPRELKKAIIQNPYKVMTDISKMPLMRLRNVVETVDKLYEAEPPHHPRPSQYETGLAPRTPTRRRMTREGMPPPSVAKNLRRARDKVFTMGRQPPRRLNNEEPDPNYFSRMVMKRPRE